MTEDVERKTTWRTLQVLSLGGKWAFVIGIIDDGQGLKVRVAKGKMRDSYEMGECPISQVQKFNLKTKDWEKLRPAIEKALADLAALEAPAEEAEPTA
ncbi:MAG: hypothetical protein KKA73_14295 [Chloroflexi bacterium]|nr:hypothetical protein [Chloroflexota bacterium]MBU1748856.1 hypothetical protein [Chloroflexota bacterium]